MYFAVFVSYWLTLWKEDIHVSLMLAHVELRNLPFILINSIVCLSLCMGTLYIYTVFFCTYMYVYTCMMILSIVFCLSLCITIRCKFCGNETCVHAAATDMCSRGKKCNVATNVMLETRLCIITFVHHYFHLIGTATVHVHVYVYTVFLYLWCHLFYLFFLCLSLCAVSSCGLTDLPSKKRTTYMYV